MVKAWVPERDFSSAPTLFDFMLADEFVRVVIGPVGGGKTFMLCNEVMRRALMQQPNEKDNIRYSRWIFVRNTMPELKMTTIKTWLECWPEHKCGLMKQSSPMQHTITYRPERGEPGLHLEVYFIALDTPKDVKKVLSLECTGFALNECREIAKILFDTNTSRLGRYPGSRKGPTTWSGIIADTNPPDEDHYLADWAMHKPDNFIIVRQPPAIIEVDVAGKYPKSVDPWIKDRVFKHHPDDKDHPMPVIHNKDKAYVVNPDAENLKHLKQAAPKEDVYGPRGYYGRQISGKDADYIHVYLKGQDGYVREGKPVIPEFNKETMVAANLPILDDRPIILGMDIGGGTLTPAAVWLQRHSMGAWLCHGELLCEDMGVERFSALLKQTHQELFSGMPIEVAWGDPAGAKRDDLYETMIFEHLRRAGIPARAAPSRQIQPRIDAIKAPMNRLCYGKAGFMVHPRCKMLIKGLNGRWNYRKMQVLSRDIFRDLPTKNIYSHCCDALGYALLGGGEYRQMTGRSESDKMWHGEKTAKSFSVWDT